jgi:hypothetical protein
MTPEIDTYGRYIREKITQLDAALAGLSEADLNRAPNLRGANSPYVIVTHVLGNMRAWCLGIICGQDLRRDRPAEFASRGTHEGLGVAARDLAAEIDAAFQELDPKTLGDRFVPAQELWGEGTPREIARRDAFAHVLEHAGIHLGHLQLTIQMLQAGG